MLLCVQLLCLDVHKSRPNLAATGSSGGCVALWDLRFQSAPLALTGSPAAAGDVWEVRFATWYSLSKLLLMLLMQPACLRGVMHCSDALFKHMPASNLHNMMCC